MESCHRTWPRPKTDRQTDRHTHCWHVRHRSKPRLRCYKAVSPWLTLASMVIVGWAEEAVWRLIVPIYCIFGHQDNWERVPWSWSWSGLMACTDYLVVWSVSRTILAALSPSQWQSGWQIKATVILSNASCAVLGPRVVKEHRPLAGSES